jgi:hypothetical protein
VLKIYEDAFEDEISSWANEASIVEQPAREWILRMNSPNVNENVRVIREEELSIYQIFGKMTEILQTVTKRRGPRGENEALERFLKFLEERQNKIIRLRFGLKVLKIFLGIHSVLRNA